MEYDFHQWLTSRSDFVARWAEIEVGIGDDAAVIAGSNESIVVSTDSIAEGTHFELGSASLSQIGRKALAVSLSDLAAMAARPVGVLLAFNLPREFTLGNAQELYRGVYDLASQFGIAIVGGDTNRWQGPLILTTTVFGRRPARMPGWRKNGAQVGDAIVVSGYFGGSLESHHLDFVPRVDLALYVAEHYQVNCATDVSDSLSLDLSAICQQSGVGACIDLTLVPLSQAVKNLDPVTALEKAISDGEDFELILTMPQAEANRLLLDVSIDVPLTRIGVVTDAHQGLMAVPLDGTPLPIVPKGYIH